MAITPTVRIDVSGARGEGFGDFVRRTGEIAGIDVPDGATDAEVLASLTDGLAEVVAAAGYTVIAPARVATTGNITLSGAQTIDGVSVVATNRVLVLAQTNAAENGIYAVAAGAWSRTTDFDSSGEVVTGSYVPVMEGDTQEGAWVLVTQGTITPGTTPQVWRIFRYDDAERLRKDLASTAPGKGASLVGFKQAGAGADDRTAEDKLREIKTVNDFGAIGDGTLHTVAEWIGAGKRFANLAALQVVYPHVTATTDSIDWAAIQAALNSITGYFGTAVLVQDAQYVINRPVIARRGRNILGDGSPEIIADFSGSGWAGDYAALQFLIDTEPTNIGLNEAFGQFSGGFRLTGKNNAGIVSTGVKFYTNMEIEVGLATNYSWLWGRFSNVIIRRFDTAINMRECWNSSFSLVKVIDCRRGVFIDGKSVNVDFGDTKIMNPTNDYTSSDDNTVGIEIENGDHYSDLPGRPEGFSFSGGLVFGHYNNLKITSALQIVFEGVVLDGASDDCVRIVGPNLLSLEDCYIYTAGVGKSCVFFEGVAVGSNSQITIKNCNLFGANGTQIGVTFEAAGAARHGVSIIGNKGTDLALLINALLCPKYSNFSDNYGEDMSGTRLFYIQTDGAGTTVDGNTCSTEDVVPVTCHPTTSPSLEIGSNFSPTYQTSFAGKVQILAGATTADLPNNFYGPESYIRPITHAVPNGNAGQWYITEEVAGPNARITLGAALGSNIDVRYTTKMLPYSAVAP